MGIPSLTLPKRAAALAAIVVLAAAGWALSLSILVDTALVLALTLSVLDLVTNPQSGGAFENDWLVATFATVLGVTILGAWLAGNTDVVTFTLLLAVLFAVGVYNGRR